MRTTLLNKILLGFATLLSLFAQGLIFAPAKFTVILQQLPTWGNLTFGAVFFIAALIIFILVIRSPKYSSNTNWTLFGIHALTVTGIHFLMDGSASHAREAGILFTGVITTLTTLGIFTNAGVEKV